MPSQLLQVLFATAFGTLPMTLYLPPVRRLNSFVETMETFAREIPGICRHALELIRVRLNEIGSLVIGILS
ncbi:hypothetical protein KSP40_PGU017183 [Platanthera guangdongensis]|uniref:Uncharacterized protein n=1 Tax=Platanthera guangdongensis TaxID=2320717 RepID=A0ABR2LL07_9ASPA